MNSARRSACQRRLQLVGGELRHFRQQRLGEVLADHRRHLQQPLLALRQPIDARRQHRLHGRRHLEPLDRRHQPVGAAGAFEMPRLDQRLRHLLGEERVAAGARVDRAGQPGEARVVAEEIRQQLGDRLAAERRQRDLPVPRLLHPLGAVLRPEVHEQQAAACRPARRPCARGTPRSRRRASGDPRSSSPSAAPRSTLWITWRIRPMSWRWRASGSSRGAGRCGSATPRKSKSSGSAAALLWSSSTMRPAIFSRALLVVVLDGDAEVSAEQLEDGQERDVAPVGDGAPFVDAHAAGAAAFEELEAQAALPGARLGHHAHHLPVARRRLLERVLERAQIRGAPDEARETAGPREVEARARGAEAGEAVDRVPARRRPSPGTRRDPRARSSRRPARPSPPSGSRSRARRALPCAARARRCGPAPCSPCAGRRRCVPTTTSPELMPMRVEKPTPCSRFTSVA